LATPESFAPAILESLLNVDVDVVKNERGLQTGVFRSRELDRHRLSLEAGHVERVLLITSGLVQVGESSQRREHRARRIEHLDFQGVKGRGGGGFSRVNMEPEGQSGRGCS
jgi:hypothetical protein